MHEPAALVFGDFQGKGDPLPGLRGHSPNQAGYLTHYLKGLGAAKFILEPSYDVPNAMQLATEVRAY